MSEVKLMLSDVLDDLIHADRRKAPEIATEMGISSSMLSKYRNGQEMPSTPTLIKMAKFFDTSTDYLLGLSEPFSDHAAKRRATNEYTGLNNDAIKNLHDHLRVPRFTPEQKHWANWFIASEYFIHFVIAMEKYYAGSAEYATDMARIQTPSTVIIDDGTTNEHDNQRKAAKIDLVETTLKITQHIDNIIADERGQK